MRRSNQLVAESAVIGAVLIAITLGGSVAITTTPPSFQVLDNPGQVAKQSDLSGLAQWYNATLATMGEGLYANASFMLSTFHFVNIPANVNQTALAANRDLALVNASVPRAAAYFDQAETAIGAMEYLNASALINLGCSDASLAARSFADFTGAQTSGLSSLHVPTSQYAVGSSLAGARVQEANRLCSSLLDQLPRPNANLTISSPQTSVETGGDVELSGVLTLGGTGLGGQQVLFYINGSFFGTLRTGTGGELSGTLGIPFLYGQAGVVQALVAKNDSVSLSGASSNLLDFRILFNATRIAIGDPPTYLPTQSFSVHGNLTTGSGVPLPGAPVRVTFLNESVATSTNGAGVFGATFTVPADSKDGLYNVSARFAPQGVFGPSFNFTTIQVTHIPIVLNVSSPHISLPGFGTALVGTAEANGSAVPDVNITVSTPWGTEHALTDQSGGFRVGVPISPFEFALSRAVNVTGSPAQPYIAAGSVVSDLFLFNPLLAIIPVALVLLVVYEAESLGVLGRGEEEEAEGAGAWEEAGVAREEPVPENLAEPVVLYRRALKAASSKFGLKFKGSQTIREVLSSVAAKSPQSGLEGFTTVSMAAEDFLYSEKFEGSRVATAKGEVEKLEKEWG